MSIDFTAAFMFITHTHAHIHSKHVVSSGDEYNSCDKVHKAEII